MSITGTMVVSKPSTPAEHAAGAVALIHLYGTRGGSVGSVLVDRIDAERAIARLTTLLERTTT